MIAVIFEVQPTEAGRQAYLDHAAALKPLLERMDGFISVERFQSLTDPGKLLSVVLLARRTSCAAAGGLRRTMLGMIAPGRQSFGA